MTAFPEKKGQKKTGRWTTKFKKDGRQYFKRGFKTRTDAQAWETDKRRELETVAEQSAPLWSEVAEGYITYCKGRLQKNTWRQKIFIFKKFLRHNGNDPEIDQISAQDIIDYLEIRKREDGPKAANRDLREINALFNWCNRHKLRLLNPGATITKYTEDPHIKYIPPKEAINKVMLVAEGVNKDFLTCVFYSGGRKGEISKLKWEDVNFEKNSIRLWTRKRKNGVMESRFIVMPRPLQEVLKRRWLTRDKDMPTVFPHMPRLHNLMAELCKKAKVKEFGFHSLRHYVASILVDSGKATLRDTQNFLGHQRATTTDLYLKGLRPENNAVVEILDDFSSSNEISGDEYQNGKASTG